METYTNWQEVDINASREKVWHTLTDDASYREWSAAFSEGSYADTDWQQGSKVVFTDKSGYGLAGIIDKVIPNEFLGIVYTGMIAEGKEDTESEESKQMIGAREEYTLSEKDGGTHLSVGGKMDPKFLEMMAPMWEVAKAKIKEIAERA